MYKARFHHIHFNTVSIENSIAYFKKFFGAKPVSFQNNTDALLTEKSYLFFNEVITKPKSHNGSSLWHIGWSGVDGQSEFDWRVKDGIKVHTTINSLRDAHWMYFYGPNEEVIEVFTENKNHSFEHIHLLATDVNETMKWFTDNLGIYPEHETAQEWATGLFKWNKLFVDNINIMVNGKPKENRTWFPHEGFSKTDGSAIDHIAFAFEDIGPVHKEMKSNGVEILEKIKSDPAYGLKSFYVRGPNELLIEIVEDKEMPL